MSMKEERNVKYYLRKYYDLEVEIRNHYSNILLLMIILLIIPIGALLWVKSVKLAILAFACITGEILYQLYQIKQHCDGNINKLTGICVEINDQQYQNKFLGIQIYGKYTVYIEKDEKIYEILASRNTLLKKGSTVTIWYDGNEFCKSGNIYTIPTIYMMSVSPAKKSERNQEE